MDVTPRDYLRSGIYSISIKSRFRIADDATADCLWRYND